MNRRDFLQLQPKLIAATGCFGLAGCDGNTGHFDPLTIENVGADIAQPELGHNVTVTWSYSFDRPDVQQRNPTDHLKSQRLIFKRLHLIGIAEQAVGPNPIAAAPGVSATPGLDVAARSFTLQFDGPIVVQLQGSFDATEKPDNSDFNPICSAMLTLRLKQDLFCRAQFGRSDKNALYPYLGYPQDALGNFAQTSAVDFTQFVAFHDAGTPGQIDLAAQAPNLFPLEHSFRAFSFSARESEAFGTVSGALYPPQVFAQPAAGQTNAMLFAGAIVFNGVPLPAVKGQDTGARTAFFFAQQQSQPIFIALPMLFGSATGHFDLADIQAGTALDPTKPPIPQRPLVVTALSTPGQLATGGFGSIEPLQLVPSGTGQLLQGHIKGATLVHDVTTLDNDIFTSAVNMSSLDWSCQFLPDDQLNQVLSIGT